MTPTNHQFLRAGLLVLCALSAGCESPLDRTYEVDLREAIKNQNRKITEAIDQSPTIKIVRADSDVDKFLTADERKKLDEATSADSYLNDPLDIGPDLQGSTKSTSVSMTLQEAIRLAVANNIETQIARIQPAINQTQIVQALAVFDAEFFTNFQWEALDTPKPQTPTNARTSGTTRTDNFSLENGLRKKLDSGAEAKVSTTFGRNHTVPSVFPDPSFYDANIALGITQPLLRGFGQDVVQADIVLGHSARKQSVEDLKFKLLQAVQATEEAYWKLFLARQRLLIQSRLLTATIKDRDQIKIRMEYDATTIKLTEANAFVEIRRSEVLRARQDVRVACDQLKRVINSPDLPISGETLIDPTDRPADLPINYSLRDAVATGLRCRPDVQKALYQIEDAGVRQRVADNGRLPRLDLSGTVRYNGIANDAADAYDRISDGEFIDYILGIQFAVPIGNRGPEALYRQRRLERQTAVLNYQKAAQDVLLDVKISLRQVMTAYELIGSTRAARRAAAENLRALGKQEEAGNQLTPEFLLDLKLQAQQRVADTATQEVQAVTDYNASVSRFYQAMGTLLERNGIEFKDQPVEPRAGWLNSWNGLFADDMKSDRK